MRGLEEITGYSVGHGLFARDALAFTEVGKKGGGCGMDQVYSFVSLSVIVERISTAGSRYEDQVY
jgi:hypothetical protein